MTYKLIAKAFSEKDKKNLQRFVRDSNNEVIGWKSTDNYGVEVYELEFVDIGAWVDAMENLEVLLQHA